MVILKDGSEVYDPRLARVALLDPRNLNYPLFQPGNVSRYQRPIGSRRWTPGPMFDQLSEGACVSFGIATQAASTPVAVRSHKKMTYDWLMRQYHVAQHNDPWAGCFLGLRCPVQPGPQYEGTSEEAGLMQFRTLGFYRTFLWAFGIEELARGVRWNGPAAIGIDWYDSFYEPVNGRIDRIAGPKVGGHLTSVTGIEIPSVKRWLDGDAIITNTWGRGWGDDGSARMPLRVLAELLAAKGTAAFLLHRSYYPRGLA